MGEKLEQNQNLDMVGPRTDAKYEGTCQVVHRAEADAKSSNLVHLLLLLTEPGASYPAPVFLCELAVVEHKERLTLEW